MKVGYVRVSDGRSQNTARQKKVVDHVLFADTYSRWKSGELTAKAAQKTLGWVQGHFIAELLNMKDEHDIISQLSPILNEVAGLLNNKRSIRDKLGEYETTLKSVGIKISHEF